MSNVLDNAYEYMQERVGNTIAPTDWFAITQDRVNDFSKVTMDDQWIHIDPERAKDGPFGRTIVHGQLTLSLLDFIPRSEKVETFDDLDGLSMVINYGFNKVRFPSPVMVGERVRVHSTLKSVEIKNGTIEAVTEQVVEVEGQDKPACVAEALARYVFDE